MDRRRLAAVTVLLAAASLGAGALTGGGHDAGEGAAGPVAADQPRVDRLVQPGETGSYLWPYTSRRTGVDGRTLALNVVVVGDPERVRTVLERRSDANWSGAEDDAALGEAPWRHASGATRYSYVADDPGETGQWVDADYQLAVGSYFTSRVHVRAYPTPSGNWTALQAHTEYWDWFRLRHTVTGTGPGARFVERDLRGLAVTTDLRREYHGLGGSGNSGWLSVIELTSAVGAGLLVVASRRRLTETATDLLLPAGLVAIVLGVRGAGVVGATAFAGTDPQLLAGVCYPALAAGPVILTARLAPDDPLSAAGLAAAGLGAGAVLDFTLVGVAAVPIRLALHRVALIGALAVVAVGASGDDRRLTAVGVGAWALALALPLVGIV